MVDKTDVQKAAMLVAEFNSIDAALAQFDNDGMILSMQVGKNQPDMPPMGVQVDTRYMFEAVPPQMIDSIKQLMTARQNEINSELTALGVTGTPAPRSAAVRRTR